jgi:HprK-related kinase A
MVWVCSSVAKRKPVRRLADIPMQQLAGLLGGQGVRLCVPPFVFHIQSSIPVVAQGLHALYAHHECLDASETFADFHVAVHSRGHGFKRVSQFSMDGFEPFTPLAYGEGFALLEWGMNWCVTGYGHNWLTVHSAVLEKKGRAVLLPAPPGSGKSTLCAALMLHGWRLLSDEMALLDPRTGLVTPAPRPVSLKNQSIEVVRGLSPSAVIGPAAHDTMKGTVAHLQVSRASLEAAGEAVAPAWVVFPKYEAGALLTVEPRAKSTSLLDLASNSFNHHVHGRSGFEALVKVVDQSQCFDLRYSQIPEALAWFDALEPGS